MNAISTQLQVCFELGIVVHDQRRIDVDLYLSVRSKSSKTTSSMHTARPMSPLFRSTSPHWSRCACSGCESRGASGQV